MQTKSGGAVKCKHPEDVRNFLMGGYCPACANFDEAAFLANRHPVVALANGFIINHLRMLYRVLDGDIVMGMVMSEIWQYNISRYLLKNDPATAATVLEKPGIRENVLAPCNAYSISQALGVPSETVRRKVRKLIELGWVKRNSDGHLVSTTSCEMHVASDGQLEFVREMTSMCRHLLFLVDNPPASVSREKSTFSE